MFVADDGSGYERVPNMPAFIVDNQFTVVYVSPLSRIIHQVQRMERFTATKSLYAVASRDRPVSSVDISAYSQSYSLGVLIVVPFHVHGLAI
jgi:hypothetical protein